MSAALDGRDILAVIPGQPLICSLANILGMDLQGRKVIEGIDATELTGVDQTHEDVPDLGPSLGFIGEGVLTMEDAHLQSALTNVII